MTLLLLALGNLGRLLTEWAERQRERRTGDERPIIELMREAWGSK
jgi:hypothetical protein